METSGQSAPLPETARVRSFHQKFTRYGAALGLLCGLIAVLYGYSQAPGLPGLFELILQLAIVGVVCLVGAALGFAAGWVANLLVAHK